MSSPVTTQLTQEATQTEQAPPTAASAASVPIAIVGMAAVMPGAPNVDTFWRNIVGGVDAVTDAPASRWDPEFFDPAASATRADRVYCRRGGFVDEFASFDPLAFGIMPDSVPGAEPDQLIALRLAAEAIDDAGGRAWLPDGDRVGVILGRGGYLTPGLVRLDQRVRTANQLARTLRELMPELGSDRVEQVRQAFADALGPNRPEAAIGLVPNLAASRIANRLDVRGPAYTVDAACASSLVAVDQASSELASGRCDVMLAGGVHHCHDITFWSVFSQLGALSRQQSIRPFHRAADGILIGEGTGVVVLKRLGDALRDGDRVYAVIRGTGVASDGRAASLFNPEPAGQVRAVRQAWEAAGLDPRAADALGLLEAHGTATPAGDSAEISTLAEVFGPRDDAGTPIPLGSVKSMIGHTMPAAAIASLIKAALAIHHGVLPPTLHCEDPHPDLKATRFEPLAEARAWPPGARPRRAGVNAFGFGGINAHVVLEQAPKATAAVTGITMSSPAERIVRLAADSPAALLELLDAGQTQSPDQLGAPCRIAIADPTPKKLTLARRILANAKPWRGRSDIWFSPHPLLSPGSADRPETATGRIAFVFPGLEAEFTPRVDDVAALLGVTTTAGHDASAGVGAHGVGVVEIGRLLARALGEIGVRPGAVAGHSVGEWTAMVNAGLFSGPAVDRFIDEFDPDSVRVPGLMFGAIGAGAERVTPVLEGPDYPGVALSHDNAPNQCIVCGPDDEIDRLMKQLRKQNVLCQALPFRSGFHTPMLEPYLGPILEASSRFELHEPSVPVWSATIAAPFPDDAERVRELFVRHLVEPVRFRQMIEAMYEDGYRVFVQTGTGALATVIGDVLAGRDHLSIAANSPQRSGLEQLRRVAAALWVEGLETREFGAQPSSEPKKQARRGMPTKLDLSGALITLRDRVPDLPGLSGLPGSNVSSDAALDALDAHAAHQPIAAELAALLRETAASANAVIAARNVAQPPPRPTPTGPIILRVDIEQMPYLIDHCFFAQRADWPDISDLFPVVPATTVIQHMMDAAEARVSTSRRLRTIAVHGARFDRWTSAIPATDIEISATPEPGVPERIKVGFGTYARSAIEVASAYPAPPEPWPVDPTTERPPHITAAQLYADRWMFHGPRFQALTELTAIGAEHVRGVITAPEAPGALLDNVGQLLGYWIMSTHEHRTVVFPVGMRRIAFYAPRPAPGTRLDCHIRIQTIDDVQLVADAQLVADGRVWADFTGWTDRRFGSHPDTRAVERSPGTATLAHAQPGGWVAVFDRWADPASRDLRMRSYLGADERDEYESKSPRVRGQWLLGRVAAKDAVRHGVWDDGAVTGPCYPAQIRVRNHPNGRPYLEGVHGTELPPYELSLAHSGEVGVALIRRAAVGIDVEQVVPRDQAAYDAALTTTERELLSTLVAAAGPATPRDEAEARWFTRFWTAKEAAAKAEGTGLDGAPKSFVVVHAELTTPTNAALIVETGHDRPDTGVRRHAVRTAPLANPDDLPPRRYEVAWTEEATEDTHPQLHAHHEEN